MRKYINISFVYAIAAMVCGVFYREFTKVFEYTGKTMLSSAHTHLLSLGTLMFLIVAIFSCITDVTEKKQFKLFMILYNIGLPFMVVMMIVRGILQVVATEMSSGLNAGIAGVAGISHIVIALGIIFLFLSLRKAVSIKK